MTRICRITCLFIVAACLSPTPGADWRQFRGPGGQGISDEKAARLYDMVCAFLDPPEQAEARRTIEDVLGVELPS